VYAKNDSTSYRFLKADGTVNNIGGNFPTTVPAEYVQDTRGEALERVANHIVKESTAISNFAKPGESIQIAQIPEPWLSGAALPVFTLPKSPQKIKRLAAGALITDGTAILLTRRSEKLSQQPGTWSYPAGSMDVGETPEDAAMRETLEEVGQLPEGSKPTGVTITTTDPDTGFTFHTVLISAPPGTSKTWKPSKTKDSWEVGGWAWVPVSELHANNNGVVEWRPRLHPGLTTLSQLGNRTTTVLKAWQDHASEWSSIDGPPQLQQLLSLPNLVELIKARKPLPFVGSLTNPRRAHRRYRLNGAQRTNRRTVLKYTMAGKSPVFVSFLDSLPLPKAQPGYNRVSNPARAARRGRYSHHAADVRRVLQRNPSGKDLYYAQVLEDAGLPLSRIFERSNNFQSPYRRNPSIPQMSITRAAANIVEALGPLIAEALGDSPSTGGTAKFQGTAKQLSALTHSVVKSRHSSSATIDKESQKGAKTLRYLVLARAAGLWPNIIDPGSRVVYRGFRFTSGPADAGKWSGSQLIDNTANSFVPNATTNEQIKILAQLGLINLASKPTMWEIAEAWIKLQKSGNGWVRPSLNMPFTPQKTSPNASQVKNTNGYATTPTGGDRGPALNIKPEWSQGAPSNYNGQWAPWASETWANVEGLVIDYKNHRFQTKTVGGWSASYGIHIASYGRPTTRICARANTSDPRFIMLPGGTLLGAMVGNLSYEEEILAVDVGDGRGILCDLVNVSGTDSGKYQGPKVLNPLQMTAWQLARQPYPDVAPPPGFCQDLLLQR
jgi:8-oxo-dGTP diphosphatase